MWAAGVGVIMVSVCPQLVTAQTVLRVEPGVNVSGAVRSQHLAEEREDFPEGRAPHGSAFVPSLTLR